MKHLPTKGIIADFALLGVAFVWGTTFQIVHDALADIGTFPFLAVRFLIAVLFLLPFQKGKWQWHPAALRSGLYLFGGYAFQTLGLLWTTPAKAAFITGLSVVLVPLLVALKTRCLPERATAFGAVLAAIGLGLLTLEGSLIPGKGDILVLCCAVCVALQILAVEEAARQVDPWSLTVIQLGVICLLSFGIWGGFGGQFHLTRRVLWALLITAVPATSLAFLIQGWAQRFTTPAKVALVFSLEPVFAALYSYFFGGETFTPQKLLGSVLVFLGIVAGTILPGNSLSPVDNTADTMRTPLGE
ncbi:MAG: DMT family transporter [Thermacetogeniaceae bacterium]